MKLFPGFKLYPVVEINGKKAIDTEYGLFEISEYESRCHQCKHPLAYKIEVEDKPMMTEIYPNFFIPYFYYLTGDCSHKLHGGFSRPIWKVKKIQRTLEEWL